MKLGNGQVENARRKAWCFCLLIAFSHAFAIANVNDRTIGQFVHTSWSAKDGAPANINALAQTVDGFLWLGTSQGLYRFDGVTFELYHPEPQQPFPHRWVSTLRALSNGDLWVGFARQGACLLRNGRCIWYTQLDGLPPGIISAFVEDHDGVIWVATDVALARLENGKWIRVGEDWGYSSNRVQSMFVDHKGTLWVASRDCIVFLPKGARRFQATGIEVGQVSQITESPGGMLWMAETTRSVRPIPLPANNHGIEPEIEVGSDEILFDDDGSLWITSLGDGIRRVPSPEQLNGQKVSEFSSDTESFTEKDGLSSDYTSRALRDREGNIWVATSMGLDRFYRGALVPLALSGKFAQKALLPRDDGNIWVSSPGGQAWTDGHKWHSTPSRYFFSHWVRDSHGVTWLIGRDHAGLASLWMENGKLAVVAKAPVLHDASDDVLARDRDGTLWFGAGPHQFFFFKDGKWQQIHLPPEIDGLHVISAFTDANGRVWFGLDNAAIVLDGSNVRTFTSKDGVKIGGITAIRSLGGRIWFGGAGGLAVLEGDRLRTLAPEGGKPFEGISAIEPDPAGDLFVSELRGIALIPSAEISKILQNPDARLEYRIFDMRDGLVGNTGMMGPFPTSVRSTDARIWFSTASGVSWIDPAHISRNLLPPPVVIRSITADERRYASSAGMRLPPLVRHLAIDYTALSLAIPERVRFRFKLEGYDSEWQDAGSRREATYTNLGPRQYRFRVVACNNDGVWNETGAVLDFSITPAWYQTMWFRLLCVVTFGLLLWVLYQLRLRQWERQYSARLEERVGERTRIARELHDTLLQSLHGLMFQFQAARNMLPSRPENAMRTLDGAISRTEQAIAESRDAIQDLRLQSVPEKDLAQFLEAAGQELAATQDSNSDAPKFRVIVEGEQRKLSPMLQDELCRIGLEVLRNAFRHSGANEVEVEIRYDKNQLRLRLRDDGKGIDAKILEQSGRPGHWGLPGVRERAQRIGSSLEFWSQSGVGTEVELTVPAAIAYDTQSNGAGFRLFRRTGNRGRSG